MTYRFTFYKIPFSETGVEYPLPTVGNPTESLASYKTAEQLTTAAFRENQQNIVFSEPDTDVANGILKSNYMRVGVVVAPGTIDTDENVAFYWVRDVECLGGVAIPPLNVTIAPDDIMTEFFSSNESIIKGRITRTSDNNFGNRGFPIRKFCADDSITYSGGSLARISILQDDTATVITSLTLSTGDMLLVAYRFANFLSKPFSSGQRYLYDVIKTMSNIYAYGGEDGTAYNASVTNITIVPTSFIDEDAYTPNTSKVAYTLPGGGSATLDVYLFAYKTHRYSHNYLLQKSNYNLCYIQTPCGFYMVGIPDYISNFSLEISIPPGGVGSDNITISLILKNEIIDITQDYSASFAVNDEAVKKAQFKQVNAIGQISNIIGAVGGAVGGVASGNYFGAVQSLAAGASGIAENAAIGKGPSQIKSSGDAYNTFEKISGLCAAYITYESRTTEQTITKYGLPVEISPYVELPVDTITESYYKFAECDAIGLSGGGQEAQATLEALFTRGVRFKSL